MFSHKKKYYLIIENIKDIDLSNIKIMNKFIIIYRNNRKAENIEKLLIFRKLCKLKGIGFYISNNVKLAALTNADGLYISSHNKNLNLLRLKRTSYNLIGSAHNIRELNIKVIQGCTSIVYSRLFKTLYNYKKGSLGIVKFNLLRRSRKEDLVPLGGINLLNLNKLKLVKSNAFAILSEVKKKPAKIFNRLF